MANCPFCGAIGDKSGTWHHYDCGVCYKILSSGERLFSTPHTKKCFETEIADLKKVARETLEAAVGEKIVEEKK